MTIPELLRKIAEANDLPNRWLVEQRRSWLQEGALEPTATDQTTLRYFDLDEDGEGSFRDFGAIEITDPLRYTDDWVGKIVVERNVPARVFIPFEKALGSSSHVLELRPEAEIPF